MCSPLGVMPGKPCTAQQMRHMPTNDARASPALCDRQTGSVDAGRCIVGVWCCMQSAVLVCNTTTPTRIWLPTIGSIAQWQSNRLQSDRSLVRFRLLPAFCQVLQDCSGLNTAHDSCPQTLAWPSDTPQHCAHHTQTHHIACVLAHTPLRLALPTAST